MPYLLLIFIEIVVLKVLVGRVNRHILGKVHYWLYSVVFFPGTLLHELSHFLMAKALLVPVGHVSLLPKKGEREIVLGSVLIARVDIIRRMIIGVAPIIIGILTIYGLIALSLAYRLHSSIFASATIGYVLFVVTNSMYSSREDLKGYWKIVVPLTFVILALLLAGARINIFVPDYAFLRNLSLYLIIPIVLDALMLLFLNSRRVVS